MDKILTCPMINEIIVHSGVFHMDDVFLVGLIKKLVNPNVRVTRTNMPDITKAGNGVMIADIGNQYDGEWLFDHHQRETTETPKSAVGLFWDRYKNPEIKGLIDIEEFIDIINKHDNGIIRNNRCFAIRDNYPSWNEDFSEDDGFNNAVDMVIILIDALLEKDIAEKQKQMLIFDNMSYERKHVIEENLKKGCEYLNKNAILIEIKNNMFVVDLRDKYIPWTEYAINKENVAGAIYEGRNNTLSIQPTRGLYEFPKEWREEKPVFLDWIHKSGFMATAINYDDAITAFSYIIKKENSNE